MAQHAGTTRRAFVQGAGAAAVAVGAAALPMAQAVAEEASEPAAVLADGIYTATASGFAGDVTVTLEVSGGAVSFVEADASSETPERGGRAAEQLAPAIAQAGGTQGVDAVAGATVTSNAVLSAADDCLAQAAGAQGAEIPPLQSEMQVTPRPGDGPARGVTIAPRPNGHADRAPAHGRLPLPLEGPGGVAGAGAAASDDL